MKTKLSVIILTWNTAQITKKCVLSVIKHLKNVDYEIILVDNNSTDNTISVIKQIKDPRIKIIKNTANLGFSKGNNIGASKAKGEFLFFLNSDMVLIDNSINLMLEFLSNHPNIGAIGPQFLHPDSSPQASVFPPQTPLNAFKEFFLNKPRYSKYLPNTASPSPVWAISGGALLIKKTLFSKINGWNEKYFFYFEDLDICRRLRKMDKLIFYFPKTQVIHYHGISGKNITSSENQWRRLIPSSIIYHGFLGHYLINSIIWSGQKFKKLI